MTNPFANLSRANHQPSKQASTNPSAPAQEAVIKSADESAQVVAEAAPVEATPAHPPINLSVLTQHPIGIILRGIPGYMEGEEFKASPVFNRIPNLETILAAKATGSLTPLIQMLQQLDLSNIVQEASTYIDEDGVEHNTLRENAGRADLTSIEKTDLTFSDERASKAFITNLLVKKSKDWALMYKAVFDMLRNQGANDAQLAAANREPTQVKAAVDAILGESGHRKFDIPVSYEVCIYQTLAQERAEATTVADLVSMGQVLPLSLAEINEDDSAPNTPAEGEQYPTQNLTDELKNHDGAIELEVRGVISVYADSLDQARQILPQIVSISNNSGMQNLLTLTHKVIDNCNLTPYEHDDESDADSDTRYERD